MLIAAGLIALQAAILLAMGRAADLRLRLCESSGTAWC